MWIRPRHVKLSAVELTQHGTGLDFRDQLDVIDKSLPDYFVKKEDGPESCFAIVLRMSKIYDLVRAQFMMTEGRACLMKNLHEAQSLLQAEVDKNPQNEKLTKMLEEVKQLRKLEQVKNATKYSCWQMLMKRYSTELLEASTNSASFKVLL